MTQPLLRPCRGCGHAQPAIYFASCGLCYDCATDGRTLADVDRADADTARAARRRESDAPTLPARLRLPSRLLLAVAGQTRPEAFGAIIDALTPAQSRALIGYSRGETLRAIAARTGVNPQAVSKALARAFAQLRAAGVLPEAA